MNSDINRLTKRDVCIIWTGTQDIGKNEAEKGIRALKDFVNKPSHTNVIAVGVPQKYT
jgi:hypothetical protein